MRVTHTRFTLSFVTVLIATLVCGCMSLADKVVKPIKVKIPDVSVAKMTLTRADLNVTIRVTNPNDVSATVSKLKYNIVISEKTVATGVYVKDVKIAANQTTETVVPIEVANKDLIAFLAKVLLTKGTPYRAFGEVEVGPLSVPFDEKGMITSKDL
jgi:LEA14-like dessication related protein